MILQKLKKAAEDYLGETVTEAVITVRPTSTTPSARPPRTPARSPASTSSASSTSPPRPRWPTASTRRRTRPSPSTTSAAAPSTSPSSRSARASSRSSPPTATPTWAATTSTSASSTGSSPSSSRSRASTYSKDNDGPAAPQGGRGEGQDRALDHRRDRDQPAVHHRRRRPAPSTWSLKLTRAKLEQLVEDLIERSVEPVQAGAGRRRHRRRARSTRWCWSAARPACPRFRSWSRSSSARSRTRASTRTRSWPSARPCRRACWRARSRTCCCSTSRRSSLGIETLGGVSHALIPRNTTIPTKKTEIFSTAADSQTRSRSTSCRASGPWRATTARWASSTWAAFLPAPRGVPQIEVTFDIDANGILNVSAKDKATGKDTRITITSSSGLSKEEVEKMVKDAEAHAAEDKEQREEIEARNRSTAWSTTSRRCSRTRAKRWPPPTRPKSKRRWPRPRRRSKARRRPPELSPRTKSSPTPATSWPRRSTRPAAAQAQSGPAAGGPSDAGSWRRNWRRSQEGRRSHRRRVRRRGREEIRTGRPGDPALRAENLRGGRRSSFTPDSFQGLSARI